MLFLFSIQFIYTPAYIFNLFFRNGGANILGNNQQGISNWKEKGQSKLHSWFPFKAFNLILISQKPLELVKWVSVLISSIHPRRQKEWTA